AHRSVYRRWRRSRLTHGKPLQITCNGVAPGEGREHARTRPLALHRAELGITCATRRARAATGSFCVIYAAAWFSDALSTWLWPDADVRRVRTPNLRSGLWPPRAPRCRHRWVPNPSTARALRR